MPLASIQSHWLAGWGTEPDVAPTGTGAARAPAESRHGKSAWPIIVTIDGTGLVYGDPPTTPVTAPALARGGSTHTVTAATTTSRSVIRAKSAVNMTTRCTVSSEMVYWSPRFLRAEDEELIILMEP